MHPFSKSAGQEKAQFLAFLNMHKATPFCKQSAAKDHGNIKLNIKAIDPNAAMSGQRAPTSSPIRPQPQPFRFWLPYRSNVGSWRPTSSRPVPTSPQLQSSLPPSPFPAGSSTTRKMIYCNTRDTLLVSTGNSSRYQ
jgi:hypothetical protein